MKRILTAAAIVLGLISCAALYQLGGAAPVIALAAAGALGIVAIANLIATGRADGGDDR